MIAARGIAFTAEPAPPPVPLEMPGVHHAFRVSERLLSGSQPEGEAAFAALARAGVKTIVSVDGAKPDVETARKFGLRYLHQPFGYDGIPAERVRQLARAVAITGDGAIFVHCHHGKHRGPAAIAVMCEATAGWTPERAEAWLRQAGTADDYPGLYRAAREFRPISPEEIARVGELPEITATPELVDTMVAIDAQFDLLKAAQKAGWATPAIHDAVLLREHFREMARTADTAQRSADYRAKLAQAESSAKALQAAFRTPAAGAPTLDSALKKTAQTCAACHAAYRNEKK